MTPDTSSNAIAAALSWIVGTLTGGLATSVAILAIAGFGLLLLSGRLPKRRGAQLILGCFVIFGAPTIAAGLLNALLHQPSELPPPASVPVAAAGPPATAMSTEPYDPYAGAALPPPR